MSIGELAELLKVMTESKSEIVQIPYDEAYEAGFEEMPRRAPDTSRIHDLIGFRTTVTLEQILEKVIDFEKTRIRGIELRVG